MNKASSRSWIFALVGLLACPALGLADVRPNPLFSQGMVLQRDVPVPIWGMADDGENVTVRFQGQEVSTVAQGGKWMVKLAKLAAGGPFKMTIEGKNRIEIMDVLVGEVWVCSGQSNMGFLLNQAAEGPSAIAQSDDPMFRLFTVDRAVSDEPLATVKRDPNRGLGIWLRSKPETSAKFSAVAYFFGRDLRKALGVPVGLIHSSWGGTAAETWTSRPVLEAEPSLKPLVDAYDKALANFPEANAKYQEALAKHREAAAQAKAEGKKAPTAPREPLGPKMPHAAGLYNAMVVPLQPFAIRGTIWYQGEANAGRAFQYRTLFPAMIKNWRDDWHQGDFPFLFVQLAPYKKIVDQPGESDWAELCEAQLITSRTVPNTAMAVITDIGEENDVHPKRKEPVGDRLAWAAKALVYGQALVPSGPEYAGLTVEGDKAIVRFKNVGNGLTAKDGPLKGFAIAGDDRKFVNAEATIVGDTVVVRSEAVSHPVAVRYGWANFPVVNLWNLDGLPASPFRTDDFPMVTGPKKK